MATQTDPAGESARARDQLERRLVALYLAAADGDDDRARHAASAASAAARVAALTAILAALPRRARTRVEARLDAVDRADFASPGDRARARRAVRDAIESSAARMAAEARAAAAERAEGADPAEWAAGAGRTAATREAAERALAASEVVARELGVGLEKIWITRGDSKVRDLHRRLHGRARAPGAPFHSWLATGQRLRFPGDPDAPLDATINCRCALWFAYKDEAAAAEAVLTPASYDADSFPVVAAGLPVVAAVGTRWLEELHPRSPIGRFIEKWQSNFVRITPKMRKDMAKLLDEHGEISSKPLFRGLVIDYKDPSWNSWLGAGRGQKIDIPTSSWSRQAGTARDFSSAGGAADPTRGHMKIMMTIRGPHRRLDLPQTDLAEAESVTGGEFKVTDVKHDREWTNVRVTLAATPSQRAGSKRSRSSAPRRTGPRRAG